MVGRQCLALSLVVLDMATLRDEPQIFDPTNWDLVGKHAEERRLTKQWSMGALWQELILPWTPFFLWHHQRMRADSPTSCLTNEQEAYTYIPSCLIPSSLDG